jgi:hypothetical protein
MGVETKVIESWLDIAPKYLDFAIRFIRNPNAPLSPYAGNGSVTRDLTAFLLAGVATAYLLVALLIPMDLNETTVKLLLGNVGLWFMRLAKEDVRLLPVATFLISVLLSIAVHILNWASSGVWRLADRLLQRLGNRGLLWEGLTMKLPGTLEDSVNAGIGFAAVYTPFIILVLAARLSIGICATAKALDSLDLAMAGLLVTALFVYLPLAIAAVHPGMKARHGFAAFFSSLFFLVIVAMIATPVLSRA